MSTATKTCSLCKTSQPITNFYKSRYETNGYTYRCKTCIKKYPYKKSRTAYFNNKVKGTQKYKARNKICDTNLYPILKKCEFCRRKATQRHHPDYEHPTIYVSVCRECHVHIEHPLENKNYRQEINVNYYQQHRDLIKQRTKTRFRRNREQILKKQREKYHQNPDKYKGKYHYPKQTPTEKRPLPSP